MLFKRSCGPLVLSLLVAAFAGAASAEELSWAQELVRPVENTSVYHAETSNFGQYKFAAGPAKYGAIKPVIAVEGKKSAIIYRATPQNSVLEIFSVYKKYLKDKGFEIVFACENKDCGWNFPALWYELNPFENDSGRDISSPITHGGDNRSYIAAKKKDADGDLYVSIFINTGWWNLPIYRIDVAKASSLETKVLSAPSIGDVLQSDGRITVYDIEFEAGKSEIRAGSDPILAEIAEQLDNASGNIFYVVAHTDDAGDLADNMKLSKKRAEAVVAALTRKYGVPKALLSAHGAGPLAPVALNSTEEGRALNCRVEIIKSLKKRN